MMGERRSPGAWREGRSSREAFSGMIKDETDKDSAEPAAKLRRLSIGLSLALLIFTFGEGSLGEKQTTVSMISTTLTLNNPEILRYLLIAAMFYSTGLYGYQGIQLPLTRQKIRDYLTEENSMFIVQGAQERFAEILEHGSGSSPERTFIYELYRKIPRGMPPEHAIVICYGIADNEVEVMRQLASKTAAHYFPDLQPDDVEITPSNDDSQNYWGHVKKNLNLKTQALCWLEDLYLFLPIVLFVIALACWYVWPMVLSVWRSPY